MIYSDDDVQKLILRAGEHIDKDTILGLRGTKAIKLEAMLNTDDEYNNRTTWSDVLIPAQKRTLSAVDVTTWSSLVRNAIDILKPQIFQTSTVIDSDEFKIGFEDNLKVITREIDLKLNSNCPQRLYKEAEEDDLIKSTVYRNNKNHMIEILNDENGLSWYLCAVYTGEIIVMLEALLDTIHSIMSDCYDDVSTRPQYTFILSYVYRDDNINDDNDVIDIIDEASRTIPTNELERDIIGLSMRLRELVLDNYKMARKYNLEKAEDIIRGIYSEDIPKDIKSISVGNEVY